MMFFWYNIHKFLYSKFFSDWYIIIPTFGVLLNPCIERW